MNTLLNILLSVFIVSIISFVGIFTINMGKKLLKNIIFIVVSFAAGSMLGGAFFDLLPEAAEVRGILIADIFLYTLVGVIVFFIIEQFIHMYHCHHGKCNKKPITYLSLMADGLHNFLDGVAIAISFLVNTQIGIAVTLAVISHEIPQEISDYGILIYGGFSRLKALAWNFIIALTAFIGALIAYFFSLSLSSGAITAFLLAFTGGGFIYMASANLIPELHKEENIKKIAVQVLALLIGIVVIWIVTNFA